jgi:hypothetical protein
MAPPLREHFFILPEKARGCGIFVVVLSGVIIASRLGGLQNTLE